MVQTETRTDKSENPSPSNQIPPGFDGMGKQQLEELAAMQKDLMAKVQDANKIWTGRMQTEATLASEFTAKLTAARSIPEVAAAYQEWVQRHMEIAAEDAKRLFADGQKLAETGARLLSSGWKPNGKGKGNGST
jgi:hypothetical protein